MGATPRETAAAIDLSDLPSGNDERFAGYGIMAQPFRSGHVLAVRRFPHNTIGAAYTSVWHCDPDGRWTMWNDAPPTRSCPRYFGPALAAVETTPIEIRWPDPWTVHVGIDGVLDWRTTTAPTPATRVMTAVGSRLPDALWRNRLVLAGMGRMAGWMLRAGTVRLQGTVPSRQWFRVKIPRVWGVADVTAVLHGEPLGPPGPIDRQRWLGGFALPNRGLFAIGRVTLETYRPDRHVQTVPAEP
ncbi:MAG TPA: hypothetical protein VFW74_10610 [Acidimicrobiia bacterium]|nr:hypothetical protein [Acidimicrobiia bacterium]